MEITSTEHYIEIIGFDNGGQFTIRIQRDCSQLQIETEDSDAFIDINRNELTIIRNCINEILGSDPTN